MSTNDYPRYPEVYVPLVGEDGNAFAILGRVMVALERYLRQTDLTTEEAEAEVTAYREEATSGDYDNLLQVTLKWVNEGQPPEEYEDDEDW